VIVKRIGGGVPLGDRRVGIPLDGLPDRVWMDELREAMNKERGEDPLWQNASVAVTADAVNGVPHLVFPTDGTDDAEFIISYVPPIDTAIAAANATH
jgi:hypothetical protein